MKDPDPLGSAVAALRELAPAERVGDLDALARRLADRRLRVLVVGAAKRGKSTLLNRLLGRDVLPTGVLPVTAIVTTVRTDPDAADSVRVRYLSGATRSTGLSGLASLVTEEGNPRNTRGVAGVSVTLGSGALAGLAVELVDTPGVGSVFEHNTQTARASYESLDAVVVVLAADPPISAEDRELLTSVAGLSLRTFVVVNKADRLAADERAPIERFTARACAEARVPTDIWLLSARDGDEGYARFRDAFVGYLDERAEVDAARAIAGHAARLGGELRDSTLLTLRAAEVAVGRDQQQLVAFRDRLDAAADREQQLADRCSLTERRLLRELNSAATAQVNALTGGGAHCLRRTFDDPDGGSSAAERGDRAQQALVELVTSELDGWRHDQAERLDRGLADALQEANGLLDAEVATVRQAATELLGVALTLAIEPIRLASGRPFWYSTSPPPTWELPGTELLRRHGPAAARRTRARLLAEVGPLVDKQVGRARADLQQRLSESFRVLLAQLRRTHRAMLDQLVAGLDAAAGCLRDADNNLTAVREQFGERLTRLNRVMADLDAVACS